MKDEREIKATVIDYGSFQDLADALADYYGEVSYYSPCEAEFEDVKQCVIGKGLSRVKRVDEPLDPDFLKSQDLFIFPDIGYGGLQRYLRSIGKKVWGSMGGSELELYRDKFLKTIESLGLETTKWVKIVGLTNLAEHLKAVEDKWIKVNRYRNNMETWHHLDYLHSQDKLTSLWAEFGGEADEVVFVVQDPIKGDDDEPVMEIGYDGWSVDGDFPECSFAGYEKKNELYLGSLRDYNKLPKEVRYINNEFSHILAGYEYRNFFATEIRVKGKKAYFIDPTMRMAGQTMEHILESCTNLGKVVWRGAHGELVKPEFSHQYAAEATLHFEAHSGGWKTMAVPKKIERWVKLYHYFARGDNTYRFPPHKSDEVGVVIGLGNSIRASYDHLQENFSHLKQENVSIQVAGFVDLLKEIQEAEDHGMEFSDKPLPKPESVLVDK